MVKKTKTRRNQLQYPALSPQHNLKSRYEEIEDLASYAHTLPPEAREWLNSYAEEEICSNFKHDGIKLNDETDPKTRSRIYGRNNQRNRCIYTREASQNLLVNVDDIDFDNEKGLEEEERFE
jgi:anaerobic selenocysteine-containing dehydrogenase